MKEDEVKDVFESIYNAFENRIIQIIKEYDHSRIIDRQILLDSDDDSINASIWITRMMDGSYCATLFDRFNYWGRSRYRDYYGIMEDTVRMKLMKMMPDFIKQVRTKVLQSPRRPDDQETKEIISQINEA